MTDGDMNNSSTQGTKPRGGHHLRRIAHLYRGDKYDEHFFGSPAFLKTLKDGSFSEPLAREGIMTYLGVMAREPVWRSVIIAVSQGVSAKTLLENNRRTMETNPAKHADIITEFARYTGYIPAQPQFFYFYNTAKSLAGSGLLAGQSAAGGSAGGRSIGFGRGMGQ